MTQNAFVEQMREEHGEDFNPETDLPGGRTVTFMGNTYDLAALGALGSGVLVLFSCLTCNMGYYCLPFIPLLLGLVGIVSAREAVNKERTQLWSWLGIGAGIVVIIAGILAVIGSCLWFAFMFANAETY
ncbi:MAG: hypothetical protein JXR84_08825 [Anaerolineae bacterium]|nr:hypothetical protein [Anaerolineae bacterium]